jgi:hypothetical protein
MDNRYYTYVFVRQDLSPEQQIVQASHVTFQLGVHSQREWDMGADTGHVPFVKFTGVVPEETYFVVIGVRNLQALEAVSDILKQFKFMHELFYENDIREHTAIATYPVREDLRGPLHAFNLLKVK